MLTPLAWGFLAAGVTLVALGGFSAVRQLVRRRPWADVLDMIEPAPPRVAMPLRCICAAKLSFCECAIDGVRNPRGAGRARTEARFSTPPDISLCRNLRIDGPTPCWHPHCDCMAREARRKLLLRDAFARQRGENIDGTPRRETFARDLDATPWACPVGVCSGPGGCTTPRVCRAVEVKR